MKYTTQKPKSFYEDTESYDVQEPVLTATVALAAEVVEPTWSGLFDAAGNKLYREREFLGFAVTA